MEQENIPQPTTTEVKYAGFWIRLVALIIDSVIISAGFFIISIILGIILASIGMNEVIISIIGFVLNLIVSWGYFIIMTNTKGTTLGKMSLGLAVCSVDGSKLTLGKIILRETIGKFLSFITIFIGYIMAGFTSKKQALHDKLIDSVVIYKEPERKSHSTVVAIVVGVVLILPTIAVLGILSSVVLASLSTARNKGAEVNVKQVIASSTVESLYFLDKNNTFLGFSPSTQSTKCNNPLITNISNSGQTITFLSKSCIDEKKYYCQSLIATGTTMEPVKEVLLENDLDLDNRNNCN